MTLQSDIPECGPCGTTDWEYSLDGIRCLTCGRWREQYTEAQKARHAEARKQIAYFENQMAFLKAAIGADGNPRRDAVEHLTASIQHWKNFLT